MKAARVLNSTVLSGRRLTISAPEDPAQPANVLVLHDGQNLAAWRAVETVDALVAAGDLAPTLIVAIDHLERHRIREFGHRAHSYGRFVVRDVLPYIRARYPVRTDRAGTWMGGSSMGGLVTLDIAAHHPMVFSRLFVLSPSVWWKRRAILRTIRRPSLLGRLLARRSMGNGLGLRADVDVWLSIGLKEGDEAVDDARRLRDEITAMRHGDVSHLRYYEDPDGEHTEACWARHLARALAIDPSAD